MLNRNQIARQEPSVVAVRYEEQKIYEGDEKLSA